MPQIHHLLKQYSPHLFWDVDTAQLDPEKSCNYIIKKVLEYGLYEDWKLLLAYYGMERIRDAAISFRELEPKAVNMIALLSKTPKEKFRCYNTTRLTNPHWNF